MRLPIVVSSLLVAGAWAGPGETQSLGTLARSARGRAKASVKVYTDADLRSSRGRANFVEIVDTEDAQDNVEAGLPPLDLYGGGLDQPPGETGGQPLPPTEEETRAKRLADLKKQVDDENKVIATVQQAIREASAELNDLTVLTYGGRRGHLVKMVEDGQKELAKSQQVIADLEEKARRDGFFLSR